MANGNFEIRNKVVSWNLKCFDMKVGDKGVTLNCSLNGKKNPDGSYPKGLPVRVFCSFESCEIAEDDYNNTYGFENEGNAIPSKNDMKGDKIE